MTNLNKFVDIICLTETFVKSGNEGNISIFDFNLASHFCRKNIKRGGVCILTRKSLSYRKITYCNEIAAESVFECCGIELPELRCVVICIYRVPDSKNISTFFDRLDMLLHKLTHRSTKKVILTGDLNINTLVSDKMTRELKHLLDNYNLQLHIHSPTRLNSCIDHIISNIPEAKGEVLTMHLSDHDTCQLLVFYINVKKPQIIEYWYVRERIYSSENVQKFCQRLSEVTWSAVRMECDLDKAFSSFHDLFCLLYNLCFPLYMKKNKSKRNELSWISKGIKQSFKTKRKLRYQYYKTKSTIDNFFFKKYSRLLKKCINKSQYSKNQQRILISRNKCKTVWSIIKNKTGNNIPLTNIEKIESNGKQVEDPQGIADAFNNFFVDTEKENDTYNNTYVNNRNNNVFNQYTIFLNPCTEQEVIKNIQHLKNTRSVGFDDISTHILKKCSHLISPILCYLINQSFVQGKFPTSLKQSVVKPLYKKGDKNKLENYRPITLVPIFSKVFERIMHDRISSFLNKFDIISESQNGFQKGKTTSLACFSLIKHITENIDNRIPVITMCFDMTKAFDHVSHRILLNKCERYGLRGTTLKWLNSYLSNRTQYVELSHLNNQHEIVTYRSHDKLNTKGVPQGSVLGPLLFIIYINDIPSITEHKMILFADDISVVIPNINNLSNDEYTKDIDTTINNVNTWLAKNHLKVNMTKTNFIQFLNYKTPKLNLSLQYNGQNIVEVDRVKFLGIILDSNCNWKFHIDYVCGRLEKFIYALKRLRCIAGESVALTAYHGYVASVLRYGLVLWGNSVEVGRAQVTQKKCIRAICRAGPRESCRPLFRRLNLLTLTCMYIYETCSFVRSHPRLFVTLEPDSRLRPRDPTLFSVPVYKSTFCRRNCYYMAIQIYNRLPRDMKQLPKNLFLGKLLAWLHEKCFYNLNDFFNYD